MSISRVPCAICLAFLIAGCDAKPMTPEEEARAKWVHELKENDPERAQELAQACYKEVGFDFSAQSADTMAKCMQDKAGAA